MKSKFTPEFWVLFFGLVLTGLGMLGATVAWSIDHFATKEEVSIERQERMEMKAEINSQGIGTPTIEWQVHRIW